jgi:7-keto-8-aminopelargonate synthetase-like enzyme
MCVAEREVWMFGGANYLDLASDPRVIAAARAALTDYGGPPEGRASSAEI